MRYVITKPAWRSNEWNCSSEWGIYLFKMCVINGVKRFVNYFSSCFKLLSYKMYPDITRHFKCTNNFDSRKKRTTLWNHQTEELHKVLDWSWHYFYRSTCDQKAFVDEAVVKTAVFNADLALEWLIFEVVPHLPTCHEILLYPRKSFKIIIYQLYIWLELVLGKTFQLLKFRSEVPFSGWITFDY